MKTIDQKTFSLTLPDGWEVLSAEDDEALVYKGTKISDYLSNPALNITIRDTDGMTFDQIMQTMAEEMGITPAPDVAIDGHACKAFILSEGGEDSLGLLYNRSADGKETTNFAIIFFIHTTQDDQEALGIVSSIVFK
ncbi:MAG: hypothetical protein IJ776_08055 [Paludibacteraceae bacterium]|nr:hypothetical protein [Paludibacteraceae bacterium]